MPFFRPLGKTAPEFDRSLPWPIDGLAYVALFMGSIAAGPLSGHAGVALVGLVLGIGISLLHGWLSDRFVDPWAWQEPEAPAAHTAPGPGQRRRLRLGTPAEK